MGKVAFVFSGQGDQFPGMGKDLAARYPEAAEVFARFDKIRPGTSAQCFQGTEEELRETRNTQPCLYALETAITAVLGERNLRPQGAAGFSLGEVTAAAAAGIFDQETGFRLVCRRGELMQEAAETADTAMAAVLKLSPDAVEAICRDFPGMYPVNYNCPGQLSVSGRADQLSAFGAAVKAAGGRMIPLKVRAAFHSPYMEQAAKAFRLELERAAARRGDIPLYSNLTARPYTEDAVDMLSRQIASPVRWEELIRQMIADGYDTFWEIGPGQTLTNMIRRIDPAVTARSVREIIPEAGPC